MIEEALVALVGSDMGMSGLIGNRFYRLVIPQDATLPACAFQVVTAGREYTHGGQSEVAMVRVQITITAASYSTAKMVGGSLRELLSGFCGAVSLGCDSEVYIFGIFFESEYDGFNLDSNLITVRQDYRIFFRED